MADTWGKYSNGVTVRLRIRGINQLMTSTPVVSMVEERAKRMAEAAGPGIEARVAPHKWTALAYVYTATTEGRKREAKEKVLIRSLGAGS